MRAAVGCGQRVPVLRHRRHALGAVAAIRDLGLRVPDQISVGGFDDLPGLSRHLTTIRQDFAEIARTAIALTEEARDGAPPRMVTVPVQ